jgi:hypothetical protein
VMSSRVDACPVVLSAAPTNPFTTKSATSNAFPPLSASHAQFRSFSRNDYGREAARCPLPFNLFRKNDDHIESTKPSLSTFASGMPANTTTIEAS